MGTSVLSAPTIVRNGETYTESLGTASWIIACRDIVESARVGLEGIDKRVQETERGLASLEACIVKQGDNSRDSGSGSRGTANGVG